MTAADRYAPDARRRRAARQPAQGATLTIPHDDLLRLVRAQSVILDVFRGWAGLAPDAARGDVPGAALDISDEIG